MRDWLELGTTPVNEDCVQVTSKKPYLDEMRAECRKYIELLRTRFPNFPVQFSIKSSPHDFGEYLDVVVYFNDAKEEEVNAAYFIESNLPETWADKNVFNVSDIN